MDTRTRLIDAALRLFAARGYDAVGVQEIVEAAGVTKPTLYHHFGNKIGLLEALLERHGEPLQRALSPVSDYTGDMPLTLRRIVGTYFQEAMRDPEFHRLRLALWHAPPGSEAGKLVTERFHNETGAFSDLFFDATEHHGNFRDRWHLYATTFQGMIQAHIGSFLRDEIELTDDLTFQAVRLFMHGIYS